MSESTCLAAECLLVHPDGRVEVVSVETHADAHRILGGPCVIAFYLSSDAAAFALRDGGSARRNAVAEQVHDHYVGRTFEPFRVHGPVLFVGVNPHTNAIETLPGNWKKPLTEWGEKQ